MDIKKFLEEKAPLIDEAIEKYIPRKFSENSVLFKANPPRYGLNLEALNKTIAEPIWDILERGGKRWRPVLFLLVCEALGKKAEDYFDFAIISEVVHNGTLIIDDIEDASEFRRGKPSTYKLFGMDVAANVSNAMYYLPLLVFFAYRDQLSVGKANKIYEIYVQEMINLSLGQAIDIAWHKGLLKIDEVSENQYLQMCAYKTGALSRMSVRMAAVLSDASEDATERLGRFAEAIGVAFQIQDDVLDLGEWEFAEKKGGRGQDITEGKRSLIVVHTLKVAGPKDRQRLIKILSMHTASQKLRDEAIQIMEKYDSIDYAKKFAQKLVADAWEEVDKLLLDSNAKKGINEFVQFLIERET